MIRIKFVGSKNRISKYIAPILQKCIDDNGVTTYYEPFVGGANMIDKIRCENRIGNDIHPQLIAMFKALQGGWIPPRHVSEEEYNNVRMNKDKYPDYYVGYVGFNTTFGAKYFGGYARGFKADRTTPRNHVEEAFKNLINQIPHIKSVTFSCGNYLSNDYQNINNAVIYCDPPYAGTTKYSSGEFNSTEFWDWCRKIGENNYIYVSEYSAPDDFECIWQKETTTKLKVHEHELRVEKLFTYRRGKE